jgi:uncharacterized OsmC-like protein
MTHTVHNGMDLEQIRGFANALREHPEIAAVKARIHHTWDSRLGVTGQVEQMEEAGTVVTRTHHTFRTDWPEPFSQDTGPTPGLESILSALGACVATTYILRAVARGVVIDDLAVTTEGEVDLRGLFGVDGAPSRLCRVTVRVDVRSEADEAELAGLGRETTMRSPAS